MVKHSVVVVLVGLIAAFPSPGFAQQLVIPDGTRVRVRLLHTISSETSRAGEPVNLEVIEDVIVDGLTVIPQGTPVSGVIVEGRTTEANGPCGQARICDQRNQN